MPRSPDLAIFVLTTDDRRQTKPITLPLAACARGNKGQKPMYQGVHYSESPL